MTNEELQTVYINKMINDIREELVVAKDKFPDNHHQLTAFNEEAGELNQAMLECEHGKQTSTDVYREAVQAAAMAIRVATEGDDTFSYDPPSVFFINSIEK